MKNKPQDSNVTVKTKKKLKLKNITKIIYV